MWVNCSYALANLHLEAAHNAFVSGDMFDSAMSLGKARQEYDELLAEQPLPYRAQTELRLAKTTTMAPSTALPLPQLCQEVCVVCAAARQTVLGRQF